MQHLTDSHSASQNTHQAEQSHCDPHNNDAPPAAHCENLCFCEQAAHSPNLLADDKAESSIAVFKTVNVCPWPGAVLLIRYSAPHTHHRIISTSLDLLACYHAGPFHFR